MYFSPMVNSLDLSYDCETLYVADGPNGLTLLNISNPQNPTIISNL
jgi:hypothetical protein